MQTQIRRPVHWKWNLLAYGLWVMSAVLMWLLTYGSLYYPPIIVRFHTERLPFWIITPIAQAIIAWLIFRIVIPDRRLPWFVAVTLVGYFLGSFVERYVYAFAYRFFHLIPGNTIREMFLGAIMSVLVTLVTVAVFQVLFLGPILQRIGWGFALTWIAATIIAGVGAPALSVLFELKYYSPSDMYPSLIQSTVTGVIAGLPLIWLRTR